MSIKRAMVAGLAGAVLLIATIATIGAANAQIERRAFEAQGNRLVLEFHDDDMVLLAYARGAAPAPDQPIDSSAMVCAPAERVPDGVCDRYDGPQAFAEIDSATFETGEMRLVVNPADLSVSVFDLTQGGVLLTTVRPSGLDQPRKSLVFTRTAAHDFYGLGQQFVEPGNAVIDWDGRVREGSAFGNVMAGFNGGATGNTQIPVLYAVEGASTRNYAVFFDNVYQQRWDFTATSQYQVEAFGDELRLYVMTGPDLIDLRRDYMGLVGRPLVPPRRMFGLWISEFGYDNWGELQGLLDGLRRDAFPLDGFVLDLQWFGGIPSIPGGFCAMGSLTFDERPDWFPDPAGNIARLETDHAINVMLIEEAYVCTNLAEFDTFAQEGCLARSPGGNQPPVVVSGFFGQGGILDYSSDRCGAFVHDFRRQSLIDLGVVGHWTDLGEPEVFDPAGLYARGAHQDVHNVFNLYWLRSIHDGYRDNQETRRPFTMSRSGAAGIQRFGAAMWSGDISSRLTSLASHAGSQMHMSFSGIDYYGADIGGFHRNLEGDLDEMYTQWFANGMMFDIPGRPHVENLCNCKETAPNRIGEFASNLANARLRYELGPYLYSLAHHAYRTGEPLMPPPIAYYQTDDNLRAVGHEKMIGRDLLAAIVARHEETERDVYLPAGGWVDWHTNRVIRSSGEVVPNVPVRRDGLFRLPLYARQGAIVPLAPVDARTLNALGERSDGTVDQTLRVRVFADDPAGGGTNDFVLYEDDGVSIAYRAGAVRTTRISQARTGADRIVVTIDPADGSFDGAPASRDAIVELVTDDVVDAVALDGVALTRHATRAAFDAGAAGWFFDTGSNIVLAKSGDSPVGQARELAFTMIDQAACGSAFAVVRVPGAGNGWDPADDTRSLRCLGGTVWGGSVNLLPEAYKFAADGTWTVNWGADGQQDGPNFPVLAERGLYQVSFDEADPTAASVVRIGPLDSLRVRFVCENGNTTFGNSVYVVGNVPELGGWNASDAVLLAPDGPYPTWRGIVDGLPADTTIEWKCIIRQELGNPPQVIQWQPGANNVVDPDGFEQVGQF